MSDEADPTVAERKAKELVDAVANEADADLLVYAGRISDDGARKVRSELSRRKRKRKNVLVALTTHGGSPDAAYRIARALRRNYSGGRFILAVDWYCKSAGTLLAIGAYQIVMSDSAELGPLDTQLQKQDEIAELTSGLTAFKAIETLRELAYQDLERHFVSLRLGSDLAISTKTAAEIANSLVVGVFGKMYEQIDPLRLGEQARAMEIARAYGQRLDADSLKPDALDRLISKYPSHSFVIDREEAETIFKRVRPPTPAETAFMDFSHPWAEVRASEAPTVFFLGDEWPQEVQNGPHAKQHASNGSSAPAAPAATNPESAGDHRLVADAPQRARPGA